MLPFFQQSRIYRYGFFILFRSVRTISLHFVLGVKRKHAHHTYTYQNQLSHQLHPLLTV